MSSLVPRLISLTDDLSVSVQERHRWTQEEIVLLRYLEQQIEAVENALLCQPPQNAGGGRKKNYYSVMRMTN